MKRWKLELLIEAFVRVHELEAHWCNSEEGEIRVQFLCEEGDEEEDKVKDDGYRLINKLVETVCDASARLADDPDYDSVYKPAFQQVITLLGRLDDDDLDDWPGVTDD